MRQASCDRPSQSGIYRGSWVFFQQVPLLYVSGMRRGGGGWGAWVITIGGRATPGLSFLRYGQFTHYDGGILPAVRTIGSSATPSGDVLIFQKEGVLFDVFRSFRDNHVRRNKTRFRGMLGMGTKKQLFHSHLHRLLHQGISPLHLQIPCGHDQCLAQRTRPRPGSQGTGRPRRGRFMWRELPGHQ